MFVLRRYGADDAAALRAVFESSVHGLASRDYTPAQCQAWAPPLAAAHWRQWCDAMARRCPYLVERDGAIVAYADLQPDGLIDHFFVAAADAGRGIGRQLLAFLLAEAQTRGLPRVYADVSQRAEALFAQHGFVVTCRRRVLLRGEWLANARMQWCARTVTGHEAQA